MTTQALTIPRYEKIGPKQPKPEPRKNAGKERNFRAYVIMITCTQLAYDNFVLLMNCSPAMKHRRPYASEVLHRFSRMIMAFNRDATPEQRENFNVISSAMADDCETISAEIYLALRGECAKKLEQNEVMFMARLYQVKVLLDIVDATFRNIAIASCPFVVNIREAIADYLGGKTCAFKDSAPDLNVCLPIAERLVDRINSKIKVR